MHLLHVSYISYQLHTYWKWVVAGWNFLPELSWVDRIPRAIMNCMPKFSCPISLGLLVDLY